MRDGKERLLGYPSIGPGITITHKPVPKMPSHLTQESPYSSQIPKHKQPSPPTQELRRPNHILPPLHSITCHLHPLLPTLVTTHVPLLCALAITLDHHPLPLPTTNASLHHLPPPHLVTTFYHPPLQPSLTIIVCQHSLSPPSATSFRHYPLPPSPVTIPYNYLLQIRTG